LKSKTGLADVLATLGSNPLPDSYVVRLPGFENAMNAGRVDDIAQQLKKQPGVDTVQIDSEWVKRLAALLRILRLVLLFLGITLGAVVVAVVFNTIRLQVMTQRDEIEVSRLFGATNSFIYRPFYYTGALLGLCAGAVALGLVVAAQQPLNEAILDLPTCMPRNSSWLCPAPWPSACCWPSAACWACSGRCCPCAGSWPQGLSLLAIPEKARRRAALGGASIRCASPR
jgi:cell division transport system permease protein